jgi:D-sedoheptulose 7-phosphate isomerase
MASQVEQTALKAVVQDYFEQNITVPQAFFEAEAGQIAQACLAMARRFLRGGRLLSFAEGPSASDAQHIAVEFVHPVLMGKRALPAMALSGEMGTPGLGGPGASFARRLELLGRPEDISVAFSTTGNPGPAVLEGLQAARRKGLLTIYIAGGLDRERAGEAGENSDFNFNVPTSQPPVMQVTHRTIYHFLWELVHVFFEHEALFEKADA